MCPGGHTDGNLNGLHFIHVHIERKYSEIWSTGNSSQPCRCVVCGVWVTDLPGKALRMLCVCVWTKPFTLANLCIIYRALTFSICFVGWAKACQDSAVSGCEAVSGRYAHLLPKVATPRCERQCCSLQSFVATGLRDTGSSWHDISTGLPLSPS